MGKQNKEVENWRQKFAILVMKKATATEIEQFIQAQLKKAREEVLEIEIPKIQKEILKDYERDIEGAREEEREKHLKYLEKQLRKGIKNLKRDRECLPN